MKEGLKRGLVFGVVLVGLGTLGFSAFISAALFCSAGREGRNILGTVRAVTKSPLQHLGQPDAAGSAHGIPWEISTTILFGVGGNTACVPSSSLVLTAPHRASPRCNRACKCFLS